MAYLEVKSYENRLEINSQAFCCEIHDTWENRKVLFVFLRALRSPKTGKALFSYQIIADAFKYKSRQNINNFVREYESCDENVFDYLRHKRKVDPLVVEAVTEELRKDVLIKTGVLRDRVNQRLHRSDLTSANIRVALEQISCTVIRNTVLREIEQGRFHPKEERVLAELFSALEQDDAIGKGMCRQSFIPVEPNLKDKDKELEQPNAHDSDDAHDANDVHEAHEREVNRSDAANDVRLVSQEESDDAEKLLRYGEIASAAGIQAIGEEEDEEIIQKIQADSVQKLLIPNFPLSEIPKPVVQMVTAMAMYASNVSLSRIGCWFGGKAKSTIYNWVIGLALALWPVIRGWVWFYVKGTRMYIDEKWLKIRKRWHYLFAAVDQQSGLPVFTDLLPTRSKWACRLFLLKLKRLGKIPSAIMTDGLKSYVSAIAAVFPRARHFLCLFHHQQNVTRCVKEHFAEEDQEAANEAKQKMKDVIRTNDTRTVKRRLEELEQMAEQKGWNITNWIKQTRNILHKLLPALRSNSYPTTTNEIERFFRELTRFYKTRCGFHSVKSAKREIFFFLVVYLFRIQAESGKAPIERIIPEAKTMPFYYLLNYPFAGEMASHPPHNVKPKEEMATESVKEAA